MSRRVVLGRYLSGEMGLKVSLPGYDALTDDDNDPEKFSFNSSWANMNRVHAAGVAVFRQTVAHALGYIPFVETREKVGASVMYDDHVHDISARYKRTTSYARASATGVMMDPIVAGNWALSDSASRTMCYVIWPIAIGH